MLKIGFAAVLAVLMVGAAVAEDAPRAMRAGPLAELATVIRGALRQFNLDPAALNSRDTTETTVASADTTSLSQP
jgi:hypothetical protein